MKKFISVVMLGALMCAAQEMPTRLDVTSQPEGASVVIDGKVRGTTPLSLFDVQPGRRLVHVTKPGTKSVDEFVTIVRGEFTQKNFALETECGLLLVKSEPAGADVKYNGVSIGMTPLLLTSFATGASYPLDIEKSGYRSKRIEVRLEDRTPVVRNEELLLDSGRVDCTSDPAGATVMVNGVERGFTPTVIENVPKGLATVTFRKAGYRDEVRELRLQAGDKQVLAIVLKPNPANLRVVTTPENAKVFVDDTYQGKAPCTANNITPGEHTVRVELAGFAPQTRTVDLANGGDVTAEFNMENVLGRVEIMTIPPNTKITMNGKGVGTTVARANGISRSEIFTLENLEAGEYSFVFSAPGWTETVRKVKVEAKKTTQVNVRLKKQFAPDTEVETVRGVYKGMLINTSPVGVTIETRPGIEQFIPQADIRSIVPIEKK